MLVINISVAIAAIRYPLIVAGHISQFLYSHETETNFDTSRVDPITITGIRAAENIRPNPTIEK
jgi:hypothetical protein